MHQQVIADKRSKYRAGGVLVQNSAQLGLWVFLGTVTMLFASFMSAYMVRSAGPDWETTPLPGVLWFNTVVLILSGVTLEFARAARKKADSKALRNWLLVTVVLGFLFLAGQLVAWQQLMARGFYVPTNPHSSFFYLLTGLHGLHLLGGLVLLFYVLFRAWPAKSVVEPALSDLTATYWHFLAGLWVFLFVLLSLW